jgi:hypothetical protein
MRRSLRLSVPAAVIAAGALVVPAIVAPATASAVETTITFTVSGGALSITAPLSTNFTSVTASAATGTISGVTVTDARLGLAGWIASATNSTPFANTAATPTTIASASVNYSPGLATPTGVVVIVPGAGGAMGSAVTAQSATGVVGGNSATWSPTITVNLPANATAGTYTGKITHSVA